MIVAPLPPNEPARLEALYELKLLDTPPEERFDSLTKLAAEIFEVPVAFVSLIDRDRQWLKSKVGVAVCETRREISFCSHAVLGDEVFVVPDATEDHRFAENPLVTGAPFVRFYAGQPLRAPGGEKIGTLCLVDSRPREFTEAQLALLQKLGGLVERELRISDLMHAQTGMLAAQAELLKTRERLQSELQEAARYLRSLLPAPMAEPIKVDWRFVPSDELGGDCLGYQTLPGGQLAFYIVDVCGHGVGAAMLSVALLNILRSQSLADVEFSDPASVLSALNRSFQMSDHGSKFFTIWYGVLTPATGELVYSSGGHPPAIQVRSFGGSSRLNSNGIAVGCVTWAQYQNMKGRLEPGDALFVFSDGAYEVPVKEREILGLDGFEKLLLEIAETPEKRLERLGSRVSEMAGRQRFSDDVSILMLQMPASPKS